MSNGKRIYFGDKNTLLDQGEYTYTFKYKTNRQIGFFKNYDELFWNVTGNGWAFPIEKVSVKISLPRAISKSEFKLDGYTGIMGSTEKELKAYVNASGNVNFFATRVLGPTAGLSIILQFPK